MATLLTVRKTTPHSTTLTLVGDDGAPANYPYTVLVATSAFANGPLKTLLAKLNAANALATLNTNGTRSRLVRIRRVEGAAGAQTPPLTKRIAWTANGLDVAATAASVSQIEIRLADSPER